MFKKLHRIVCPNQKVKYNITKHNPLDWIFPKIESDEYSVFDVDGYTISGTSSFDKNKVPSGNFTRVELEENNYDNLNDIDLIERIKNRFERKIINNILFSNILGVNHWVIVTLNNYPLHYNLNEKLIFSLKFELKKSILNLITIKKLSFYEFEKGIKKLRGFSFNKVKTLKSGPSHLSCYSSNKTLNPFPGDLDGCILNKVNNKVVSLIEFKTHNINSPINQEHIGKYGKQDWRRFEVLFNLQLFLEKKQNFKPKVFYVAWGTGNFKNHEFIKVDNIAKGEILKSSLIKRPKFGIYSSELFQKLL
tara:strand:+ start:7445 stop:8362 length:918 start_codon:yes stop_codon:yes gene_type:complete